ncbi:MAG: M48 family metallopeptidase [Candidatus Limnocylindrales bacterium]
MRFAIYAARATWPFFSGPTMGRWTFSIGPLEAARSVSLPEFRVRRSNRARRSRLTITDRGEAVVVLPVRAPEQVAADLVSRHRRWIDNHQRRIRARMSALEVRQQLGAGREIVFCGEPHRVVSIAAIDGRRRATVDVIDGRIVVTTSPLEERTTATILEPWLREQARAAIEQRVLVRSTEMGLTPSRVAIRDQKTRWGSASRRGTLSFNWRLVMSPPHILDYVVVHELAHLREAGHSKAFWRLVDRYFSNSRGARCWLREHHDEMRHALD